MKKLIICLSGMLFISGSARMETGNALGSPQLKDNISASADSLLLSVKKLEAAAAKLQKLK